MDLSLYKKMVGASSIPEAYELETISHVNELFEDQPSFEKVVIDGIEVDSILNNTDNDTELRALFRPNTKVTKGQYVSVDKNVYMITEFVPNKIYPKATFELCNSALRWYDSDGVYREYKCIVSEGTFKNTLDKVQVISSSSDLLILVKYDSITDKFIFAQRFVFGNKTYEVTALDAMSHVYNEEGYIKMRVALVSTSSTDDIDNGVADDEGNSGWGEW